MIQFNNKELELIWKSLPMPNHNRVKLDTDEEKIYENIFEKLSEKFNP